MHESAFEEEWKEWVQEVEQWFHDKITRIYASTFSKFSNEKWTYLPNPTIQAMYLFCKLKNQLSKLNIEFEIALEVGFFTETENRFIDIAVLHNGVKHAIEVHGSKEDEEKLKNQRVLLEKYNWIVDDIYTLEIEDDEVLPHSINYLVK